MLKIDSLSFAYEDHYIFQNISYELADTFHCIIGMNGVGKSTFAKLIVGILSPQKGCITYDNKDLSLTNIGYLSQKLLLNNDIPITVEDFVMMGCIRSGVLFFSKQEKQKIDDVLEQYNLIDKKNMPMQHLSGGQLQKALIARVLVSDPEFIVLDEPFVSLDAQASQDLLEELKILKNKKMIILITHEINIITSLTDNVLCISNDEEHHDDIEYLLKFKDISINHLSRG